MKQNQQALTPAEYEEEECEEDLGADEIRIPANMKPFLNKDLNFEMFIEMLTNKVDV